MNHIELVQFAALTERVLFFTHLIHYEEGLVGRLDGKTWYLYELEETETEKFGRSESYP